MATEVAIPTDWNVNTSEAVLSNDPNKIYKEWDYMRKACPVAHVEKHNGYWILSRYEDVKNVCSDSSQFISGVCAVVPADPRGIRRPPLKFDGKDHTPYRTALDRTLKASRLKRLEPILEKHAQQELGKMLAAGGGNMSTEFGAKFSGWVETEWLNLDEEDGAALAANVLPFTQSWRTGDWAAVKTASDGFYEIARRVMASRRESPLDPEEDPASSLLLEKDADGNPLDEFNLIGALRQSLIVAMVAPAIVISATSRHDLEVVEKLIMAGICKHLSEDKQLQQELRENEDLIPAALEEFIRLYVPYRGFSRTAVCPVTIGGQLVPDKEPMTVTYAAANRDPAQFEDPTKFILNRENIASHLGFGKGRHRCAGMPLARMMLKIFLQTLLRGTTDFEIDGPLEYARLPEIGMISCPMKFTTNA